MNEAPVGQPPDEPRARSDPQAPVVIARELPRLNHAVVEPGDVHPDAPKLPARPTQIQPEQAAVTARPEEARAVCVKSIDAAGGLAVADGVSDEEPGTVALRTARRRHGRGEAAHAAAVGRDPVNAVAFQQVVDVTEGQPIPDAIGDEPLTI